MQPDARLLAGLLDHKAATGGTFSVDEAQLDVGLRPDDTERERSARWGWTRHQVRNLLHTGDADPLRPSTKANQGSAKINQETAPDTAKTAEVNQGSTKANQGSTEPTPSFSLSPPAPTGPAPQGAENPKPRANRKTFAPPEPDEVRGYAVEAGLPDFASAFCDFHASKGWRVGKANAPMKDWRAAYRTWCRNEPAFRNGATLPPATSGTGPLDVNPLGTLNRAECRALAERYRLPAEAFVPASPSPTGVPLWRCRVEELIRVGAATEQQVLDSQRRAS